MRARIAALAALLVVAAAGVAEAQTVIPLQPGGATLYVTVDPAILGQSEHGLATIGSGVTIVPARVEATTCVGAFQTLDQLWQFLEPLARPAWLPASYDPQVYDLDYDGYDLKLCLVRPEGVYLVTVSSQLDPAAITAALEAIAAGSTTPPLPEMEFAVGDPVTALWKYDLAWQAATIAAINPDATYLVTFDYVGGSRTVAPHEVRARDPVVPVVETPAPPRRRDHPYGVGVAIQADLYGPTGMYGAYDVKYQIDRWGASLALDYDSRRTVKRPDRKDPLSNLPGAKLVGGARAMVGTIPEHGIEVDAQAWVGYRLGMIAFNITPVAGAGADGVGLDADISDGGFPTAGYWLIGASFHGERATSLDAGFDLTVTRLGRIGDDVVDSEIRVSGSASIHGWFGAVSIHFYGGLGIMTIAGGKRF